MAGRGRRVSTRLNYNDRWALPSLEWRARRSYAARKWCASSAAQAQSGVIGRLTCCLPDRLFQQLLVGGKIAHVQCELFTTCRQSKQLALDARITCSASMSQLLLEHGQEGLVCRCIPTRHKADGLSAMLPACSGHSSAEDGMAPRQPEWKPGSRAAGHCTFRVHPKGVELVVRGD